MLGKLVTRSSAAAWAPYVGSVAYCERCGDGSLGVTEHELQTMAWPLLVDKIVQLQHHQRLCIVRHLSAHDIVSRIMRKENYMIGMLNKGVLSLAFPRWLPGVGPVLSRDDGNSNKRLVLTKTLEWSLNWCVLQNMFDK